jgi:hypothetical protein
VVIINEGDDGNPEADRNVGIWGDLPVLGHLLLNDREAVRLDSFFLDYFVHFLPATNLFKNQFNCSKKNS